MNLVNLGHRGVSVEKIWKYLSAHFNEQEKEKTVTIDNVPRPHWNRKFGTDEAIKWKFELSSKLIRI